MYHGDFGEDYDCPGCGQPGIGGSLCQECQDMDKEEALWNFSWNLYHGPTEEQLQQAAKTLGRGECTSVTLFFSLHEEDEDGGLTHISHLSKFLDSDAWDYEGAQWCMDFKHPEGGQSPVRGRWNPTARTGSMDFQIPPPPAPAEASTTGAA